MQIHAKQNAPRGGDCSTSYEALKGVSLEWGEEGEREDGTGSEDSTGDGQWRSEFKQDLQSHQRRYDMQAQGAPESLGRSLRGGEDIMPWRPSPTLESQDLVSGEASCKLSRRSPRFQGHSACASMLHAVPCAAEFMISQQEPLEPSEAKSPFPPPSKGAQSSFLPCL
jgi:hypothetical protein